MSRRRARQYLYALVLIALIVFEPGIGEGQEGGDELVDFPASYAGGIEGPPPEEPWWSAFEDEHLLVVIDDALSENLDVAAAIARLRASEAQVTRAASAFWPTLSLDASISGQPMSSLGFQFGGLSMGGSQDIPGASMEDADTPEVVLSTSAMVSLRYQFDLWGRATHAWRASQMLRDASRGDSDALAATITLQVGNAYFDAVAAQQQIDIVNRQIEVNHSLLELLELRFQNDQAAAADVLQQRQQLASARARLPQARAARRMALQRLAVLLGRSRASGLTTSTELPDLPPPPSTGTPRDLLDSRADLRAAFDRLEASRRQATSARRAMLPTLSVGGNAGYQGFDSGEYRDQSTWGFSVTLSVPAFQGFADHAALREAQANADAARHSLQQGIVQATSDIEGAIASEAEQREQLEAHQAMFEAARQAFDVARDAYVAGVGNYLSILAALGSLQAAELTVLQSERAVISARLALYAALGGEWTEGLAGSGRSSAR